MPLSLTTELASLRRALEAEATPARARNEKAYLKSSLEFFGAPMPVIDRVARSFKKAHPKVTPTEVVALARRLWASHTHEERTLAVKLLHLYPACLVPAQMPFFEKMLRAPENGWAHVDEIAIHLVGTVLAHDRKSWSYLKKWAKDESFWLRRASLIAQLVLLRHGEGDPKLFMTLARPMVGEREFFIRKALGWTIRELARARPELAFAFLLEIKDASSGLTLREGAKHLPPAMKRRVLA